MAGTESSTGAAADAALVPREAKSGSQPASGGPATRVSSLLAALLILVSGPALVVLALPYAASWLPYPRAMLWLGILFSPTGVALIAFLGYALAVAFLGGRRPRLLLFAVVAMALVVAPICYFLSIPIGLIFFGAEELSPLAGRMAAGTMMVAAIVPTLYLARLFAGTGAPRRRELRAILAVAATQFVLSLVFDPAFFGLRYDEPATAWSQLLLIVPFAMILRPSPGAAGSPWRAVPYALAAVLPVYALGAAGELLAGTGSPALWPLTATRGAATESAMAEMEQVEVGERVRVGERWYAFPSEGTARAVAGPWPDRLELVQLDFRPEVFGLPPLPAHLNSSSTTMNIFRLSDRPAGPRPVGIVYRDLTVSIGPLDSLDSWPAAAEIQAVLVRYMEAAEVAGALGER